MAIVSYDEYDEPLESESLNSRIIIIPRKSEATVIRRENSTEGRVFKNR